MRNQKDKHTRRHPPARHERQRSTRSPDHARAPAFPRTAEGVVSANRAGFGFVRVEGQEEAVFLPPPQMIGVMHGDRVRVQRGARPRWPVLRKAGNHPRTRHQVLRRHARSARPDRLRDRGGPAHRHALPGAARRSRRRAPWRLGHRGGHALRRRRCSNAQARVTRRLDPEKPVELACEAAIARFDLPREFSPEAVREAESLRQPGRSRRSRPTDGSARPAAGHHRRRRREGLRRRGVRRAACPRDSGSSWRSPT